MAAVLVVSNFLVQFPLGDWLTLAAFTYPAVFLVTDCVNRFSGADKAARVALFGFVFGVPLSFAFNALTAAEGEVFDAVRISVASGMAFAAAQAVDIAVFSRLRRRAWWLPPVASSVPASVLDTGLFFGLAFFATEVPWVRLAAGDLLVKGAMVFLLLLPYRWFVYRGRCAA